MSVLVLGATLALSASTVAPMLTDAATAAAKAQPQSESVYASLTKVTSSTHHHLTMYMSAYKTSGDSSLSVSLQNGTTESHYWSFNIPKSALTLKSNSTGKLKVSKKTMGGYGVLNLVIKAAGKLTSQKCHGKLISKSRKVKITGQFVFNTKSKGSQRWGVVGGKKFTFKTPSYATLSYNNSDNCTGGGGGGGHVPPPPCAASVGWNASQPESSGSAPEMNMDGYSQGKKFYISGFRFSQLPKPKGATRYDSATYKSKAFKVGKDGAGNATLTAKLGKTSATIDSTGNYPSDSACGKGKKNVNHSIYYYGNYKNGSKPLTVPMQAADDVRIKNSTDASFHKTTVKPAS